MGNINGSTRLFKTSDGSDVLPSVIYLDKRGHRFVGKAAQDRITSAPANVAAGFKRLMGTKSPVRIGGQEWSPEECSAAKTSYGALFAINGVLIALLQPRMTSWLALRPRAWVLAISALVFGLGFGLFGFVSTPAGYAIGIAIWTVGEIAHLPTSNTVVADLAPASLRGRYQGIYSMSWGFGSVAAPIVGGAILDGPGSLVLWVGCAVLMALVGVCQLGLGASIRERASRPEPATAAG